MPRPPANAAPTLSFAVLPLSAALLAVYPLAVARSDRDAGEPPKPCDTRTEACRGPAGDEAPWLRLKLDQLLSEKRPVSRETTPTYARAQRIEGTLEERIVLEGNAEIRRGGTVLRGDRITYTQATDQVDVDGNARIFSHGASFSAPSLSFKVDAQTGADVRGDLHLRRAPGPGRGDADRVPRRTAGQDGERVLHDLRAGRQVLVGPG